MVIIKRTEAKVWGKLIITHAYPRESSPVFQSDYSRVYVYLHRYPLEITPVFRSDYSRTPFYLYTESLLFKYVLSLFSKPRN